MWSADQFRKGPESGERQEKRERQAGRYIAGELGMWDNGKERGGYVGGGTTDYSWEVGNRGTGE